ncbi:MAG: non-heme iron oxygenase ferredoxin subunit [Gammaproteobacteria bacterium]|jgi:3-phenylpropionate/trans-cinnamate dioxygenase ferredoxin subunit|nr:non-heme iron oxygenase ferredoxin subunit [Gammaproteobacteria bacterium]MBT3488484.1 non-heme iron oxygenase ferredoxin subunit [Gammaproteobacteria bacterium]MBT3718440.1 non-heme iron oxygenase ferredoxin subunit [Gammaproteobacteria bacterium]MBT3845946.1 non-heme iron oxygenase ferredoxin subunit [Gammaproteobacteria bacterium]MBT3893653.1 non-heme iron oxygenase ferredoxin subunit [Gammaproteobacteria bacterium]
MQKLLNVDELAEGKMRAYQFGGHDVLVAHTATGFYAIANRCPHDVIALDLGCLEGEVVRCSLHGSRFSLQSGEPLEPPAEESVTVYPLKIEAGAVWVELPE